MTRRQTPGTEFNLAELPTDPRERHEVLVDLFGQFVMWMRSWTAESTRNLVSSQETREQLGVIHRRPYEKVAEMRAEDQERALILAEKAMDGFIELLLSVLSHRGCDFPLGEQHAVRYKIEMEIVEQGSEEVVHSETVNRDGRKHFADYWGRWLNQYGDE